MQPKDLALRLMQHETFSTSLLVKIFISKKRHGYLLIQNITDIKRIVDAASRICTLKQSENLDASEIQSRMIEIKLETPLLLPDMNTSRNLLSLLNNPMKTLSDIDRKAQSFYSNPKLAKKGSKKAQVYSHPDTLRWLVNGDLPSYSLSNPTLNFPVTKVSHKDDGGVNIAILSILDSDLRIFVKDPRKEVKNEGGVVLWNIDPANSILKRQWKVIKSPGKRTKEESVRYSYVKESQDSSVIGSNRLSPKERWEISCKVFEELDKRDKGDMTESIIKERISCLSTLGEEDSSQGMFNKIQGIPSF